jgi:hypothetical protein
MTKCTEYKEAVQLLFYHAQILLSTRLVERVDIPSELSKLGLTYPGFCARTTYRGGIVERPSPRNHYSGHSVTHKVEDVGRITSRAGSGHFQGNRRIELQINSLGPALDEPGYLPHTLCREFTV